MTASAPRTHHIYIVGAQCTGKTSIVSALESHFGEGSSDNRPVIVRDVARNVLAQHSFTPADITSSSDRCLALQKLILEAQAQTEKTALEQPDCKFLISDGSGVDPISCCMRYIGQDGAAALLETTEWHELEARLRTSLIVVCEAAVDRLTDDGVRLTPSEYEDWRAFHVLSCGLLDRLGLDYVVLPCEITQLSDQVDFILSRWRARASGMETSGSSLSGGGVWGLS
ncbi:AAA domain-containing protein [Bombardia bombarda]|uniref:AAA domain-containing protein n=1 Tax=Bombardia bombarda TaxID=252184 RepID=A0AA39WGE5_9PEZI|nr:AAA domain-containing protein [Bombardia bombarda]